MLDAILDAFARTAAAGAVLERVPRQGVALRVAGLPGSSPAALTAWLAQKLPSRLLVVVAATPADAERWLADLTSLTDLPTALYPQREGLGEEERLELLQAQIADRRPLIPTDIDRFSDSTQETIQTFRTLRETLAGPNRGAGGDARTVGHDRSHPPAAI